MKKHFQQMARYNQWANRRLYAVAERLSTDDLWADKGAFFGSLMGTLNHILVGDTLWLARFTGEDAPVLKLNSILHRDLPSLRLARDALDQRFLALVEGIDDRRLTSVLSYRTSTGAPSETPFAATLSHVFNHQTHHRGQAHGLISQLGEEAPILDLIYFVREGG